MYYGSLVLHGYFCPATKKKEKIIRRFLFRIMVKYWPFPVRKGTDGMPQAAERVKCIK